jgi:hypothetical protein
MLVYQRVIRGVHPQSFHLILSYDTGYPPISYSRLGFINPRLTLVGKYWDNGICAWMWLVVSNIFYFPFHIWDVILPIDFHIFQDGYCTTKQIKNE